MIRQADVPLICTMSAILLSGRISDIQDVTVSVADAVHVAERILHKVQSKVQTDGQRWIVPQARQPQTHTGQHQNYD